MAKKRKTKAQRPPAAIDDPVAVALLLALRDGDPVAAKALADWLEEQQDPRAADVRDLADARCVLPVPRPHYWRWVEGLAVECLRGDEDSRLQSYPMACGPWWEILRVPEGVSAHIYAHTPQASFVYGLWGGGRATTWLHIEIGPSGLTEESLRAAFERCRAELVIALCGHSADGLRACQTCGRSYKYFGPAPPDEGRCASCRGRRARRRSGPPAASGVPG